MNEDALDRLPSLPALRVFEAAGRVLSFTRAARELNVTQAAVSHQIRALEAQIGTPLFHRSTRKLELTAAGRQLLPSASQAFETLERAVAAVRRAQTMLAITTTPAFGARWLAPRLGRFADRHPDIKVSIRHTRATLDLGAEGLDLAIRGGLGAWPDVESEPIGALSATIAVATPDYIARLRLAKPDDMARATLLHDYTHEDWTEWMIAAGLDAALARRGPMFDDENVMIEAALSGQGVALVVQSLVAREMAQGRLVPVFDLSLSIGYGYHLVYAPGSRFLGKVAAFRRFILAEARSAPLSPPGEML